MEAITDKEALAEHSCGQLITVQYKFNGLAVKETWFDPQNPGRSGPDTLVVCRGCLKFIEKLTPGIFIMITKASEENYWYKDLIGEIYSIKGMKDRGYLLYPGQKGMTETSFGKAIKYPFWVDQNDAIIYQ